MGAGSINLDGGFVGGKSKSEVGLTVEVIATKVYHVWVILCLYVFCKHSLSHSKASLLHLAIRSFNGHCNCAFLDL
jgi:hypothetical protein